MVSAYYTCNLLPTQLISRCGYAPRWLGKYVQDSGLPARREALGVHPMTCPYVTRLVAAADALLESAPAEDCLIVPGSCDAMRRMGDLLAATYPERVFSLSMPRSSDKQAIDTLAVDLLQLEDWLRGRLPLEPAGGDVASAGEAPADHLVSGGEPPAVDYPLPPRPGGVFVVAGPLSDDSLLRLIGQLGAWVAGLESCTSPDRCRPLATLASARVGPAAKAKASVGAGGASASGDRVPEAYRNLAAEMLAIGMCPRRSTAERWEYLKRRLDSTRPSSVIYARQSFCDPGAYDALLVSALARERGLPYLEIEVGFPFDAGGQLRTRVEAFLEARLLEDDLLDDDLLTGDETADGEIADDGVTAGDQIAGDDGVSAEKGIVTYAPPDGEDGTPCPE